MVDRLTYSVEEAARALGIGRSLCYELCRIGQLPSIRLRGRILVPKAALLSMLGEDPETTQESSQ